LEKCHNTSHSKIIEQITSQLVNINQEQLAILLEFLNTGSVTNKELMDQKLSLFNNDNAITKKLTDQKLSLSNNGPVTNEELTDQELSLSPLTNEELTNQELLLSSVTNEELTNQKLSSFSNVITKELMDYLLIPIDGCLNVFIAVAEDVIHDDGGGE
ncbi:18738_t:CDS:2, partial [Racocetra fulgida]